MVLGFVSLFRMLYMITYIFNPLLMGLAKKLVIQNMEMQVNLTKVCCVTKW
jgi:hypothetical protein